MLFPIQWNEPFGLVMVVAKDVGHLYSPCPAGLCLKSSKMEFRGTSAAQSER